MADKNMELTAERIFVEEVKKFQTALKERIANAGIRDDRADVYVGFLCNVSGRLNSNLCVPSGETVVTLKEFSEFIRTKEALRRGVDLEDSGLAAFPFEG